MPALTLSRGKVPRGAVPVAHVYGQGPHAGSLLCVHPDAYEGEKQVALYPGEHFGIEPSHDPAGRDVLYIVGMSGSGKSHTALQFARRYHQLWPDRLILLFTGLAEDATLDQLGPALRRVNVRTLAEKPFDIREVDQPCLAIFDDVEPLQSNKAVAAAVQHTLEAMLTTGRHKACSVLTLAHVATNGKSTRLQLLEAQGFVTFAGNSYHSQRYLLQTYAGLSNEQIAALRRLKSRWTLMRKLYPCLVLADGEAYLPNEL